MLLNHQHKDVALVPAKPLTVLVLCTGNSARSIMAEAVFNGLAGRWFRAYSAGSHPVGLVHPLAIEQVARANLPTLGLSSKHWDEFARPGAPALDFVLTVCSRAAGEACPMFPGEAIRVDWSLPDPAAVTGPDGARRQAFADVFNILAGRISALAAAPLSTLDKTAIADLLRRIGTETTCQNEGELSWTSC